MHHVMKELVFADRVARGGWEKSFNLLGSRYESRILKTRGALVETDLEIIYPPFPLAYLFSINHRDSGLVTKRTIGRGIDGLC